MVVGGMAYAAGRRSGAGQEQEEEYADDEQYAPPPAPPAPAAPAPSDDMTTELERLASLHTSGVLSDDEFAAAKAKVLNG